MNYINRLFLAIACIFLNAGLVTAFADDEATIEIGDELFDAMMSISEDNGSTANVGNYSIHNYWLQDAETEALPLRHFFMHGLTDEKATVIPWDSLLLDAQAQNLWFDPDEPLAIEAKSADLPTVKLTAGQSLTFRQPVLTIEKLNDLKGQKIRFFIWLKGERCGFGTNLWNGAPAVTFILKDALGNQVSIVKSPFKTRGSFPWFCYHLSVAVPADFNAKISKQTKGDAEGATGQEALASLLMSNLDDFDEDSLPPGGGLYLSLKNPASGTARFTALSWEIESEENTPAPGQLADPEYGSLAPNPVYDELPMHFFFGTPVIPWNFINGNENIPKLTSADNLKEYFKQYKDDWFHCQYGFAQLASFVGIGREMHLIPDVDSDWLDTISQEILALQDKKTGLWLVAGKPSLLVTEQIISHGFTPKTLAHSDRPAIETPWNAMLGSTVPNAELLAKSILEARITVAKKPVYWNRFAFNADSATDNAPADNIDLGSTAAALNILQTIAASTENAELQKKIREAVATAVDYVLQNMIQENGLWYSSSHTTMLGHDAFLPTILNNSDWAEATPWPKAPAQTLSASIRSNGDFFMTWKPQDDGCNSIRIFAAPIEAEPATIGDANLIGILNLQNAAPAKTDPYLLATKIQAATRLAWNLDFRALGADYLFWKLGQLGGRFIVSIENDNLTIPKARIARLMKQPGCENGIKFYAAGVNGAGQQSPLVPLCEKTSN